MTQRLFQRSLDEAIAEAQWITAAAYAEHEPRAVFSLFSGGNDSLVLLHLARQWTNRVLHVNTTVGLQGTTDFVHRTCEEWGLDLSVRRPPRSYRELVLEDQVVGGLPGPGVHFIMYQRLKERALRQAVAEAKTRWNDRVMFLTGIRADESRKRMGYTDTIVDTVGSQVWVNPIYFFTDDEMAAYRVQYDLPRNDVADLLGLSGECLCGSFGSPEELDMIEAYFPDDPTVLLIRDLERQAREQGLRHCVWGEKRPNVSQDRIGPLCSNCIGQTALLFEERT